MTGTKFLSRKSALAKAGTAASIGAETTAIPEHVRLDNAGATGGATTALPGGSPILHRGSVIGGVGVGSGNSEQDIAVGRAMPEALEQPSSLTCKTQMHLHCP